MKANCTDVVKFLYDYDILDDIRSYISNQRAYEITGKDIYLNEIIDIKFKLQQFFDISSYDLDLLKCQEFVKNYFKNKAKTRKRLAQRIAYFLSKVNESRSVYFVTLTFDDEKYDCRQPYSAIRGEIRDFVKQFTKYYILNKDYGDLNFRLHFHGVIVLSDSSKEWFERAYMLKFGFCNLKNCNTRSDLLSKYIEKLSFHALKISTQKEYKEHVIYSRLDKNSRAEFEFGYGEHAHQVCVVGERGHKFYFPFNWEGWEVKDEVEFRSEKCN